MATHSPPQLSRNESLVLATLTEADAPLSAYRILDELRDEGLRAPMQIYRALDKLMARRVVHRLETLNAYVACAHSHDRTEGGAIIFAICDSCGEVREWADPTLDHRLSARADAEGYDLDSAIVELRGHCPRCRPGGQA